MFNLGIKIDLSLGAFQPREETAEWVKEVIQEIEERSKENPTKIWRVLDIFAGSGFIGLSILKNISNSKVDFAEINPSFVQQIKLNLRLNQIDLSRVNVIQSDVFKNVSGQYDYVLANPPYVARRRKYLVQNSVLENDPLEALWGGEDGMKYIKILLEKANDYLLPSGRLYFEFSPEQKGKIEKLTADKFRVKLFKDSQGFWRWGKVILEVG
ncbi:MAG TPA: hypothetical protein ENL06_00455 [Candidatus Portnoybacteria bacterium]|nr:hypothetical protein [Candidatus Portnoybacteria bacterium]